MLTPLAATGTAIALLRVNSPLHTALAFGLLGYVITLYLIPQLGPSFMKVGLRGRDMSKPPQVDYIPESMGVVLAVTYMVLLVLLVPFVFFKYLVSFLSMSNADELSDLFSEQYHSIENNHMFPHNRLAEFLSGALCLLSTILLGFFDDLFDIRWRHKFFLPAIASLPLLIVYYVDFSVTSVVVPSFVTSNACGEQLVEWLSSFFAASNRLVTAVIKLKFTTLTKDYDVAASAAPKLLDLGIFYYVYMSALSIFSPNSINILAGINGLEVGQSIVLGTIFLINDACYLLSATVSHAAFDAHMLSAIFILPFMGVSLGLFQYNFYPSRVFVGDTYCYFSGMVFAVVGILGHFSKTLLLFLVPQILNFVYSVPQLFNVLPCSRHRLPRYNAKDNLMYPSYGELLDEYRLGSHLVGALAFFGLILVERDQNNRIVKFSNLTIINLALVWLGPMREDRLCIVLLVGQLLMGLLMIAVRHTVGPWLFGYDNLTWGAK
ncbi:hypothetical protein METBISCDRAFT_26670 [Metschnikowia bicuspidata]|uniref:UDP-N-acetylglucosamine--dolichyl-phosphate N-acetylglucosaminephosphotransferase n=1 Tax=Metschnikowia bicuspidata TaxID=27322 RepID=A0A4P9ZE89_9ASCO|nr:hypothetical protein METBISCDRAFT_26670 [Metschnikowia bicuspidata]